MKMLTTNNNNQNGKGGIGILDAIQINFIILKLLELINWSWQIVLIPLQIEILVGITVQLIINKQL